MFLKARRRRFLKPEIKRTRDTLLKKLAIPSFLIGKCSKVRLQTGRSCRVPH